MIRIIKNNIIKMLKVQGYDLYKYREAIIMTYDIMERFLYFKQLYDKIKNLDGDIVECGVGRGDSLFLLAILVKDEMKGRKLWGFDSFEGFPYPSQHDISVRNPKKGQWGDTNVYLIYNKLINSGFCRDFVYSQITLVKGFFKDSLLKYRGSKISLLHIDVDLYESYSIVLNEFYPKVIDGGIIIFDEYINTIDHLYWPGAQKAIDEYLGEKKHSISRDKITGKYYLIKR